jgi:hypothetical protein
MPKKKPAEYEVIATEGNGGIKLVCKNNIYYLKFLHKYAVQFGISRKNSYR